MRKCISLCPEWNHVWISNLMPTISSNTDETICAIKMDFKVLKLRIHVSTCRRLTLLLQGYRSHYTQTLSYVRRSDTWFFTGYEAPCSKYRGHVILHLGIWTMGLFRCNNFNLWRFYNFQCICNKYIWNNNDLLKFELVVSLIFEKYHTQ